MRITGRTNTIRLKDIAEASGVTVATVSSALNGTGRVSDEVRERIMKISRKLNYQPNLAAQLLKSKKVTDVALIINDRTELIVGSGFYHPLVAEFVQLCELEGLRNQIEYIDTFDDTSKLPWLMTSGFAGGVLHVGYINQGVKEWLEKNPEYPFVAIDEPWRHCIRSQCSIGVSRAVQYLAAAGHRNFGLMTGPLKFDMQRLSYDGFMQAVADFKLDIGDGRWVTELAMGNDRSTMAEAVAWLKKMVKAKNRPTALICLDMRVARAAIFAAMDAGLKTPGDLSIIGYGAGYEAEQTFPAVTAIERDMQKVVTSGMDMLQRLIAGRPVHEERIWIEPKLIIRDTVTNYKN